MNKFLHEKKNVKMMIIFFFYVFSFILKYIND